MLAEGKHLAARYACQKIGVAGQAGRVIVAAALSKAVEMIFNGAADIPACKHPRITQVRHQLHIAVVIRVCQDQVCAPVRAAEAAPQADAEDRICVALGNQDVVFKLAGKTVVFGCIACGIRFHVTAERVPANDRSRLQVIAVITQVLRIQHVVPGLVLGIDGCRVKRIH